MEKKDKKSEIRIRSRLSPEFSSNITVDNVTYHVQTEDMGKKSYTLVSRIYLKGEVVSSKKSDYSHITKLDDFEGKLRSMMERQHKSITDQFIAEKAKKRKLKSEYFEEVAQFLKRGDFKTALDTARQGLESFPMDPFLLSHYGFLVAVVEKKPQEGISICKDAIGRLRTALPFGFEVFYPLFYLNLGRAYLLNKDKTRAVRAFREGLKSDHENRAILLEMKKLGTRKKPPIPFLGRDNPLNKYIGLATRKKA